MSETEDRIMLAEAMGWKSGRTDTVTVMGRPISHTRWFDSSGWDRAQLPDPFTDANDDYAVLEWIRSNIDQENPLPTKVDVWDFHVELNVMQPSSYKVGDYARAAIAVLRQKRAD